MHKRKLPRINQYAPVVILLTLTFIAEVKAIPVQIELGEGWSLIRDDSTSNGKIMSTTKAGKNSIPVKRMPATVLKVLMDHGEYHDLFKGDNLTRVPPLWRSDWWYQTEIKVPEGHSRYALRFSGLSYRT